MKIGPRSKRPFLYAVEIEGSGLVKIGCTGNLKQRLDYLSCWSRRYFGRDIRLLGVKRAGWEREREIHRHLEACRPAKLPFYEGRTEFFLKGPPVMEAIAAFGAFEWKRRKQFAWEGLYKRSFNAWLRLQAAGKEAAR